MPCRRGTAPASPRTTLSLSACAYPLLEREEIHPAGDRQYGARDVPRALGAEERDGVGDVLGLAFLLHGHALDHALVERAQAGVGRDDAGRHRVARHVVARALDGDRLGEADHADLGGRVRRLAEASHEAGDRQLAASGGRRERVGLAQAARGAGDEGDLAADAEVHRDQRPLNSGSRLAKKAWMPSAASSLLSVGMNASISTSIERAIGASSPSSTALMMAAIASGARLPS